MMIGQNQAKVIQEGTKQAWPLMIHSTKLNFKTTQPKKKNLQMVNSPFVFGLCQQNYLVYKAIGQKFKKKESEFQYFGPTHYFQKISPQGQVLSQYSTKRKFVSVETNENGNVLILTTLGSSLFSDFYSIQQWNSNTGEIDKISSEEMPYGLSPTMIVFPESSLVCICYYFESHNEFDEFAEKNDICFEKVNNRSMVAIKSIQASQKSNLAQFYTYSTDNGLKKQQIVIDSPQQIRARIIQITELQPGAIFLSIEKIHKRNNFKIYNNFLLTQRSKTHQLSKLGSYCLTQNHNARLSNYFKTSHIKMAFTQTVPHAYVNSETFEILHHEFTQDRRWTILSPADSQNLQIWSRYDEKNEVLEIQEKRLIFIKKQVMAFLLVEIDPGLDDDLICQALELFA